MVIYEESSLVVPSDMEYFQRIDGFRIDSIWRKSSRVFFPFDRGWNEIVPCFIIFYVHSLRILLNDQSISKQIGNWLDNAYLYQVSERLKFTKKNETTPSLSRHSSCLCFNLLQSINIFVQYLWKVDSKNENRWKG